MKKKILVCETLSDIKGGQMITLAAERLCRDEYEFVFMIPGEGELAAELRWRKIKYYLLGDCTMKTGVKGASVIPKYAAMSLRAISRIRRAAAAESVSLIYAPGPAAMPWAAVAGAMSGLGVVWHLHHVFEDRITGKLLRICAKFASVRRIAAISEITRDQFPLPPEKCTVVPNPIDPEKYSSGDGGKIRAELSIPDGSAVICQIGYLSHIKRQDITLGAAEILAASGLNVYVILCGGESDGEYAAKLRSAAESASLAGRVKFLGERHDVPDILAASDVCVVPSMEGFSMAALEAVCAEVPVVCPDGTGCTAIVRDSGFGVISPSDACSAFAESIRSAFTLTMDRQSARERARAFITSHSEENFSRAMCEIFATAAKKQ